MADNCCSSNTVLSGPVNPNFLATNYYFFSLSRFPDFTYTVQSANLPMISTRAINQPTNLGTFPKIPATNYYFDDLQVNFLVNADMSNWMSMYDWLKGIGNLKDDESNFPYDPTNLTSGVFSEATLMITNSAYVPILSARFFYVFPKSLGGINFTTQNLSYEPVTCTVNFSYSYYEIVSSPNAGVTC